ncbi:DUF6677 family protein [Paenibacillus sp. KS-LC4]|uniref:DUF4097 family beta strand repeat-containing protein n=1 Tax=Paenibacillus sp. KS-LC4 TaxID=2979727 RepID=UPI0030CACE94
MNTGRRKSRLLTVLLAFLWPGAGHLYTGEYTRGLLLAAGILLDAGTIVRLADADGAKHLLLIVYLGLALPVFYFISVYDALQSLDRQAETQPSLKLRDGILIMVAGILLMLLLMLRQPTSLFTWFDEAANYAVGPVLGLIAVSLVLRQRLAEVFRLGSFTAALFIAASGALLLWDEIHSSNAYALMRYWWPVLFIGLGGELIAYSLLQRRSRKQLRLDFIGSVTAVVIAGFGFLVTQYADLPFRWIDQYVDLNGAQDYGEEKGFHFQKELLIVPMEEKTTAIQIYNVNGKVTLQSGNNDYISINTEVWVDIADEAEADKMAEKAQIEASASGEKITLQAKSSSYGENGTRKPRINMIVTVPRLPKVQVKEVAEPDLDSATDHDLASDDPAAQETSMPNPSSPNNVEQASALNETSTQTPEQSPLQLEEQQRDEQPPRQLSVLVHTDNGPIKVVNLDAPGGVELSSDTGEILAEGIQGSVQAKANNGTITLRHIIGDTSITLLNGAVTAASITGNVFAEATNGALKMTNISGDIEADTKNGKININEAIGAVKAATLNGGIELASSVVGGDWDVDSSVGEIKLTVPQYGSYTVYGSVTFGAITTNLPLEVSKKTVRGTIGDGQYRLQINANNSIAIQYSAPEQ